MFYILKSFFTKGRKISLKDHYGPFEESGIWSLDSEVKEQPK